MTMTSNRSYLIIAMRDWIADNQLTPHMVVDASLEGVKIPIEHLDENDQIVLDVTPAMVRNFEIDTQQIVFDAAFPGVIYHMIVPTKAVLAIYCKENGRGMIFEDEDSDDSPPDAQIKLSSSKKISQKSKLKKKITHLKIIK